MGCLAGAARIVLVAVNVIFLLLGLTMTAVGFFLRFGQDLYMRVLKFGLDQLQDVVDKTQIAQFTVNDIDIGEALQSIAIGLIVGGLVLVAISVLGCCGACCKLKVLLWVYAIVIIVCVLLEAVAIGILYGKPELVKDHVKSSLDEYNGLGGSDVNTLLWNIVMIQFKCCGVDNYQDFDTSLSWAHPKVGGVPVNLATPITCCKDLPTAASSGAVSCALTYDETKNNGMTGCFDIIWGKSLANTAIVVPVLAVCGLVQIAFILLAILIARDKHGVSPDMPRFPDKKPGDLVKNIRRLGRKSGDLA